MTMPPAAETTACEQCGKRAIGHVNDVPLCVDCYAKLQAAYANEQAAEDMRRRGLIAQYNHILDQAGATVGMTFPHIQMPPVTGAVTLNNIKIDNSVVGAINTGNVRTIDVSLSYLHQAGNDKARDALKALTEAILAASIDNSQKNDLVEQVAFLTEQAVAPTKDRKPGLIKATLNALTEAAGTVSSMGGAWQAAEPVLKMLFNL
jgi:hypothetical protein